MYGPQLRKGDCQILGITINMIMDMKCLVGAQEAQSNE